ncbi:hypothetical protein [Endothiovibrio diazotrophicus]
MEVCPCFIIFVLGGLLVIYGGRSLLLFGSSKAWCKAAIQVVDASVKEVDEIQLYGGYSIYCPRITYEYEVGGISYVSSVVSLDKKGVCFDEEKKAIDFMAEVVGRGVVFFNKRCPGQCALVTGFSYVRMSHYFSIVIGGVGIILLGLLVAEIM